MSEEFTPRTVAIVALASLVGGFVAVFGGGMLMLRARTEAAADQGTRPPAARPARPGPAADAGSVALAPEAAGDADPVALADGAAPEPGPEGDASAATTAGADGGAPVQAAGVTITPGSISRCFVQGSTVPIAAAGCDALPALDQHMIAKAADIAACSHAHGRLSLIIDFRFSTSFARAWGGPSSSIADAGTVAACVRRVTAPLPLAAIPHTHDRYIVVYGIEW